MKELACQRTPTPFSTALAAEFALSLGLEPDKMFVSLCKSLRNAGSGKKTPERSLSSQFQRLFGGPHRYSNILIVRPKCINRCSCFPNPQNAQFWIWKKCKGAVPTFLVFRLWCHGCLSASSWWLSRCRESNYLECIRLAKTLGTALWVT